MQSQIQFDPVYEIGYVFKEIQKANINTSNVKMSARNFRVMAKSILMVLQDSVRHPMETAADQFTHSFVIDAANGLIEAADYLDELAERKEN